MTLTRRGLLASAGTAAVAGCLGRSSSQSSRECPITVGENIDARIGFTGDVMLGRNVDDRWREGPSTGIWGSTLDRLQTLDGLFVNLECCLSTRGLRRPARTYYFRADPGWAVPALDAGGVTWAGLANNHLLDYGSVALADTLDHLSDGGIARSGAGPDLSTAIDPAIVDVDGITIAVLAFTDQSQSYSAGADSPGTAYGRLDWTNRRTRRLVTEAMDRARAADPDLLVASLHWGPNWVTEPSQTQRRFAHWLVDRGVDLVHGHSAHVIQGVEVYRGRPIIYDAGDFVDDYAVKPDLHNDRSFLFELHVDRGQADALRLVPVEIENSTVQLASDQASEWLRDRMRTLSAPFETTLVREGAGLRIPLSNC
jgi:poly-gamma-glutamate synthesis protein (capsule biosynthesis protein)